MTNTLYNITCTAYCACALCCGKWSDGITASGSKPKEHHTVACNFLPFGTKIQIGNSTNVYVIEDRMAKKYSNRIDIFFENHRAALIYGKQTNNIRVLK